MDVAFSDCHIFHCNDRQYSSFLFGYKVSSGISIYEAPNANNYVPCASWVDLKVHLCDAWLTSDDDFHHVIHTLFQLDGKSILPRYSSRSEVYELVHWISLEYVNLHDYIKLPERYASSILVSPLQFLFLLCIPCLWSLFNLKFASCNHL